MRNDAVTIDGIILAAGQSRRMGQPKAELETTDGESFLERAARTLRTAGCRRVIALVNAAFEASGAAAHRVARELQLEMVVNADPGSEQIDSLRLGLQRLDDTTDAVLVLPVDVPLLAHETAAAVVASFRECAAAVVVPACGGAPGHPILLARTLFDEIVRGTWQDGVRSLLLAHEHDVRMIDVDDPGILIDIDTPADYARHVAPQ
jgi:molybdenum cofactor cytidylyltransferase